MPRRVLAATAGPRTRPSIKPRQLFGCQNDVNEMQKLWPFVRCQWPFTHCPSPVVPFRGRLPVVPAPASSAVDQDPACHSGSANLFLAFASKKWSTLWA
jgi:hypothetical protein